MSEQELPFAPQGITLIYGDNGSGKSGYCRILRQLCRARRERREPVLRNVYASTPQGPGQAKILYEVGGELKEHVWVDDGTPTPKELSRLSLFDAHAAPIYVDKQNQIEFLPEGLDLLPRVGTALQRIADLLDREVSTLLSITQTPLLHIDGATTAGALAKRLDPNAPDLPTKEQIEEAGRWSAEDEDELSKIQDTLRTLAEPRKSAAQYRRIKDALAKTRAAIGGASTSLADAAVESLRRALTEARAAREAAQSTATASFKDDPFGAHIGSEAWRRLFQYAREFSGVAYPGETFPVTGVDKHCVLCQQPLTETASDRLTRFHTFLSDTAARDAERREKDVAARIGTLKELVIPTAEEVRSTLGEYAGVGDESRALVERIATYSEKLRQRQKQLVSTPGSDLEELPTADEMVNALDSAAKAAEARSLEFERSASNDAERRKHENSRAELEARKLLNAQLAAALERRDNLAKLQLVRKCRASCDTTAVSRKASTLRDEHLSTDFETRLASEIEALGVGYLPIKVASKSERGASYLGISLDQNAGARTGAVLSEGEFRVLALACFLAEVSGIPGHDGIIIDDPVSSLDHLHIRQVARRLVAEATRRQVIIFTHSLPFYYEVLEAAQESSAGVQTHWVQRATIEDYGKIDAHDAPWQVKKVKERLGALDDLLKMIPKPTDCTQEHYATRVKAYYGMLRETWERLVEERLLNGVVGRFLPGVKTQSLKGVIVEDVDYKRVFTAMAKASRYSGHDGAVAFQTSLPDIAEMRQDLESVRAYEKELKNRATSAENRRKELEDPIKAKTA